MTTSGQRRRGGWPVAGLNAVVGGSVLILVAVLALVVNPPAPPGIAAFAPQANKPITKAPPGQSSSFGEGDGACAAGQECAGVTTTTTTSPKGTPRGVPSSLQCYTWPDGSVTQTFDPQSPPCVATWDDTKGNGGATSLGVTASEIRVALPINTTQPTWPGLKPIVDFFNTRYQFYGRKINVVPFSSQQATADFTGDFNQPDMQRADATQTTQLGVFASFDFIDPIHYSWSLPVYLETLTKAKIVSINGGEMTPYGSTADLQKYAPYVWTYYSPIDAVMQALGVMTCRQLVGKPAVHAGDASLRSKTRKFAALMVVDSDVGGPMPGLDTLLRTVDDCGVKSPKVVRYHVGRGEEANNAAAMNELKNDGVTSLFWFPFAGSAQPSHPMNEAAAINFHPEWVTAGWNNYLTASTLNAPSSETGSSFGVGVWNKQPPEDLEFWHRAFLASGGDPAAVENGGLPDALAFYNELLLLAAGIQMAGPKLTPETFAAGLRGTKFANPGAGRKPFYQGRVGFGPNDPTMVDDFMGFWLDTRMTGAEVTNSHNLNNNRSFCYVDLGLRYLTPNWPASEGFYAPNTCR
jgi:hypothetical protein